MSVPAGRKLNDDGYCFACGKNNPAGLAMKVEYTEDEARCRIVLERRFQGWQGIAHGGIVSTLLDEIMAHAVLKFVGSGVTASMEVRYKARCRLTASFWWWARSWRTIPAWCLPWARCAWPRPAGCWPRARPNSS